MMMIMMIIIREKYSFPSANHEGMQGNKGKVATTLNNNTKWR